MNVTFVPTDIGTKLGNLVVKACTEQNLNPCKVGYLYDIKASALDVAIRSSFDAAIEAPRGQDRPEQVLHSRAGAEGHPGHAPGES